MPKATITAVVNQKGGTAKTTTSENLGFGLAREGKRVLLVDTDPQASLTIALGNPQPDNLEITLTDLMKKVINEEPIAPGEGILHHPEGVDLVPSSIELSGMEVSLVNTMNREKILRQYLDTVKNQYDFILTGQHSVSANVSGRHLPRVGQLLHENYPVSGYQLSACPTGGPDRNL